MLVSLSSHPRQRSQGRVRRGLVAAAVEGRREVALLAAVLRRGRSCGRLKATLSAAGGAALGGLALPCRVAFDREGRLWGVGAGAGDPSSGDLCLAAAQPHGGPDGHTARCCCPYSLRLPASRVACWQLSPAGGICITRLTPIETAHVWQRTLVQGGARGVQDLHCAVWAQ